MESEALTLLEIIDNLFLGWMFSTLCFCVGFKLDGYSVDWRFFANMALFLLGAVVLVFFLILAPTYGDFFWRRYSAATSVLSFSFLPAVLLIILPAQAIFLPTITPFYKKTVTNAAVSIGIIGQILFAIFIELIPIWLGWVIIIGLIGGFLYWFNQAKQKQKIKALKSQKI